MKHTPGPWSRNIPPARKYRTIFAGRNTHVAVLSTLGLSDEELEANAALISAAPELLAALEALSQHFLGQWEKDERPQAEIDAHNEASQLLALAAIAKAKGE